MQGQVHFIKQIAKYLDTHLQQLISLNTIDSSEIKSMNKLISYLKKPDIGVCHGLTQVWLTSKIASQYGESDLISTITHSKIPDIDLLRKRYDLLDNWDGIEIFNSGQQDDIYNLIANILVSQGIANQSDTYPKVLLFEEGLILGRSYISTLNGNSSETILYISGPLTQTALMKLFEKIPKLGYKITISTMSANLYCGYNSAHSMGIILNDRDFYDPNQGESNHKNIKDLVNQFWSSGRLNKLTLSKWQDIIKYVTVDVRSYDKTNIPDIFSELTEFRLSISDIQEMCKKYSFFDEINLPKLIILRLSRIFIETIDEINNDIIYNQGYKNANFIKLVLDTLNHIQDINRELSFQSLIKTLANVKYYENIPSLLFNYILDNYDYKLSDDVIKHLIQHLSDSGLKYKQGCFEVQKEANEFQKIFDADKNYVQDRDSAEVVLYGVSDEKIANFIIYNEYSSNEVKEFFTKMLIVTARYKNIDIDSLKEILNIYNDLTKLDTQWFKIRNTDKIDLYNRLLDYKIDLSHKEIAVYKYEKLKYELYAASVESNVDDQILNFVSIFEITNMLSYFYEINDSSKITYLIELMGDAIYYHLQFDDIAHFLVQNCPQQLQKGLNDDILFNKIKKICQRNKDMSYDDNADSYIIRDDSEINNYEMAPMVLAGDANDDL